MKPLTITIIGFTLALSFLTGSCRKSNYSTKPESVSIKDDGSGTGTVTWLASKEYLIEGFVFVNDGQTLTIEAGTVIRAKSGQGENASALIVARGGKIIAEGTANKPIIFTSESDDLNGSVPLLAKGLWGGLIILGNATTNSTSGEGFVEGIPLNEPRAVYGGNDDNDNSGVLRYVSIRHGGTNIGNGNEINGLTLAAVGSKTTIEYIEVVSNADDGFEFFGGTVNTRYLISAYCGDDAFDYDEGFRGYGQFWLAIQETGAGSLLGEHDGGSGSVNGQPYSIPFISNVTYVGRGSAAGKATLSFSRSAGGIYVNSIFINQSSGVFIEYKQNYFDCYDQFINGNLKLENNLFFSIASNDTALVMGFTGDDPGVNRRNTWTEYFSQAGNQFFDAGLSVNNNMLHAIPNVSTQGTLSAFPSSWFINVNYKGAFNTTNWTLNWSLVGQSGKVI